MNRTLDSGAVRTMPMIGLALTASDFRVGAGEGFLTATCNIQPGESSQSWLVTVRTSVPSAMCEKRKSQLEHRRLLS